MSPAPASGSGKGFLARAAAKPARRFASRVLHAPLYVLLVAMVVVLALVTVFAVTRPNTGRPASPVVSASPSGSPTAIPTVADGPTPAPELPELRGAIEAIETTLQVSMGVAIVPISEPGAATMTTWQAGTLVSGLAWSTMDVPISMAVLQEEKKPEDLTYLLKRAITQGSEAADLALWQFLGTDEQAASKTSDLLRSAGDDDTVVAETSARTDYPVFTQTRWRVADQAEFAGVMYCMPGTWQVLARLADKTAGEGFGIEALQRSQVKTGWGTEPNGTISVRQFGLLVLPDGDRVGVSVAVQAIDGSLETAQVALDQLAADLTSYASGFPGSCD